MYGETFYGAFKNFNQKLVLLDGNANAKAMVSAIALPLLYRQWGIIRNTHKKLSVWKICSAVGEIWAISGRWVTCMRSCSLNKVKHVACCLLSFGFSPIYFWADLFFDKHNPWSRYGHLTFVDWPPLYTTLPSRSAQKWHYWIQMEMEYPNLPTPTFGFMTKLRHSLFTFCFYAALWPNLHLETFI